LLESSPSFFRGNPRVAMACVARPPLARHGHGHGMTDRHDAMARMRARREQVPSAYDEADMGAGNTRTHRARERSASRRGYDQGELDESSRFSKTLPSPRGGARGPSEALAARSTPRGYKETNDEPLPPGIQAADFKTLQAMIAKGIQENEEDGILMEASAGGREWGKKEEAEEAEWKEKQRMRREVEASERTKERERASEERKRRDEERRQQQMEELERELQEEKRRGQQQIEEQENLRRLCRREFDAAKRIQAHHRGRRSRTGRPMDSPSGLAQWEPHGQLLIPCK